jgi:TonB family protein
MMRRTLWIVSAVTLAASVPAISGWAQQSTGGAPAPANPPHKVALSPGVAAGLRIGGDMPQYPAIAKAAQVQGTVVLQATVSKEGTVENLRVINGPPMLQSAAMNAVRTWTYKPYLLNGEPVEVETQVNVVFSLPASGDADAGTGGEAGSQSERIPVTNLPPGTTPADLAPPEHPITEEQVQELMDLTGMAMLQRQMLQGLMPAIRQSMPPYVPDDVLEDFENRIMGGDMKALIVKAYQNHVSTEDAAAMIEFYKTPAGHRAILVMPVLMRELQETGAQLGQETMEKVIEAHHLEIEAAKEKYEQEHSWSPPQS